MLHKTRGIVLHTLPYGDKYLIVAIYTELFGRVGYLITPARRGKGGVAQALVMPLSLLELEVEHRNDRDLQRIHEARSLSTPAALQTHPAKNAEALFLSEVLYRVIREKESDPPLFHYLFDAVRHLDRLGVPHEPVRTDPYTGRRFLFFADPDRLPLELYEKD